MRLVALDTTLPKLDLPPGRVPLHPFGSFTGNGLALTFNDKSLQCVAEQLQARGNNPWPLDYHHASLKVEEGRTDKAPVAAFVKSIMVADGFVYGEIEGWTESAALEITEGKFAYISPVLELNEAGHVLGYHSFALTNRPGTAGQRRIGLETSANALEAVMRDLLVQLLGLSADATDDQIRAALESFRRRALLGDVLTNTLGLEAGVEATPELRGRVLRLVGLETVAEDVARTREALENDIRNRNAERVTLALEGALNESRILQPESAFWRTQLERDFDAARLALSQMPRRVPTEAVKLADPKSSVALEDGQAQINKLLGVSAEAFQKFGGEA